MVCVPARRFTLPPLLTSICEPAVTFTMELVSVVFVRLSVPPLTLIWEFSRRSMPLPERLATPLVVMFMKDWPELPNRKILPEPVMFSVPPEILR